jgi:hypothetical protein
VQLFIRYIHLVTTLMLEKLPVSMYIGMRCILSCVLSSNALTSLIVESGCLLSRLFWGPMISGFAYRWERTGGSQISAGRGDFHDGSIVLSTLSKGLEIELSDFEAENAMLKGDYLRQVVEIVIGGVPTVLEICFMCFFMSLGRIRL